MMNGATPDEGEIPVQPVPTSVRIEGLPAPGSEERGFVVLRIGTPTGIQVYFLPAAAAIGIGQAMRRTGKALTTGLHLPPSSPAPYLGTDDD